jgi:hypothetical protein
LQTEISGNRIDSPSRRIAAQESSEDNASIFSLDLEEEEEDSAAHFITDSEETDVSINAIEKLCKDGNLRKIFAPINDGESRQELCADACKRCDEVCERFSALRRRLAEDTAAVRKIGSAVSVNHSKIDRLLCLAKEISDEYETECKEVESFWGLGNCFWW